MGKLIDINYYLSGELETKNMLGKIAEQNPKNAFVLTWPADGGLPEVHSTTNDIPVIMYRLNEFMHKYFDGDYGFLIDPEGPEN